MRSSRGSQFTLCVLFAVDERFPRYPALPVVVCSGYKTLTTMTIAAIGWQFLLILALFMGHQMARAAALGQTVPAETRPRFVDLLAVRLLAVLRERPGRLAAITGFEALAHTFQLAEVYIVLNALGLAYAASDPVIIEGGVKSSLLRSSSSPARSAPRKGPTFFYSTRSLSDSDAFEQRRSRAFLHARSAPRLRAARIRRLSGEHR